MSIYLFLAINNFKRNGKNLRSIRSFSFLICSFMFDSNRSHFFHSCFPDRKIFFLYSNFLHPITKIWNEIINHSKMSKLIYVCFGFGTAIQYSCLPIADDAPRTSIFMLNHAHPSLFVITIVSISMYGFFGLLFATHNWITLLHHSVSFFCYKSVFYYVCFVWIYTSMRVKRLLCVAMVRRAWKAMRYYVFYRL